MKDSSSFPGSAASPEIDYVNATLLGDDPWLKLKVELLLVYGYLPRPPENHSDFGSFTELVCMWLHPSGNLSFIDDAVIVECRDVCRKGELQLAQFRPNHVCGAIKLIKQMEIRYVPCSCLLTYLCHDKLHSLVKAHMRSMERNSQIPAIVDHILLIMIFDGVAMKLRYVGIHSTSLGFLYGLVPTKANPDVFSSRFQYHEVSWSVCDFDFGLTLLLSSVSLSQRLSGHDYKLHLWSTSLVMQRMQNIQKQLRVVGFCCTPLEFLFGLLGWNHVSTLLGLNLKLSPDIGDLQLGVSSYHLFDVQCFHPVSLQRWSQDYDLIRQTIVAHFSWFGFILEFLYGSLPRPPDVLYVFSSKPYNSHGVFKSKMQVPRLFSCPTDVHMQAAHNILKYLKNTPGQGLFYSASTEYRSMAVATTELLWLHQVLTDLHIKVESSADILTKLLLTGPFHSLLGRMSVSSLFLHSSDSA